MDGLTSPEELLDLLYGYIGSGDLKEAMELFEKYSSGNHISRFEIVLIQGITRFKRVGEYIVLWSRIAGIELPFLVGLDDTYRFFCHSLPYGSDPSSEEDIRKILGFDIHYWESDKPLKEGMIVRLQGDLVVVIERILADGNILDKKRLFGFILETIFTSLLGLEIPPAYREVLYSLDPTDQRDAIEVSSALLAGSYGDIKENVESIFRLYQLEGMSRNNKKIEYVATLVYALARNALPRILRQEKKISFRVGRHVIRLIGVLERDLHEAVWGVPLEAVRGVLILRPQNIVVYHPEHMTSSTTLPPSFIRLDVLNAGPLRRLISLPRRITESVAGSYKYETVVKILVMGPRAEDKAVILDTYSYRRFVGGVNKFFVDVLFKDCFLLGDIRCYGFLIRDLDMSMAMGSRVSRDWIPVLVVSSSERPGSIKTYLESHRDVLVNLDGKVMFILILEFENSPPPRLYKPVLEYIGNLGLEPKFYAVDPLDCYSKRSFFRFLTRVLISSPKRSGDSH